MTEVGGQRETTLIEAGGEKGERVHSGEDGKGDNISDVNKITNKK